MRIGISRNWHSPFGKSRPRVAIAGFQHETNTFSPISATFEDFVREDGWPALTRGEEIFATFGQANIPIGGFIGHAAPHCEIAPVLWASAEPSNAVADHAFEALSEQILDGIAKAMPIDGIYLDLHGAMVTESFEDGEGELLRRLRGQIGNDVPVVASLDFHANLTPRMIEHSDVLTVFRTYPHLDMAETGRRAAILLLEAINSDRQVFAGYKKLPFIVPLHSQCTDSDPADTLYQLLPGIPSLQIGHSEIALGFPPADIFECGPGIVAHAYDKDWVEREVQRLEAAILVAEHRFCTEMELPRDAARLAQQRARPGRPVILADVQDNSGAGATSDTTGLLKALVEERVEGAVLGAVCDPQSVEMAHGAGLGAEISLALGGKSGGVDNPSFLARFKVIGLSDGEFEYRGKMMEGLIARIGPTAALEVLGSEAKIVVVATSKRIQCLDRAIFSHLDIEPSEMSVVAVKSSVHFRADFEPVASEIVLVEAPGSNPCRLEAIEYRNLRPGVRLL
ncbi:MAG: M81 family metallopeptidase [Albidovulum sp.]|nr:M81 family metallopeptidase [Albidovulum sp.]